MNGRYENIRYYTPFQLFNPHRNGLKAFELKNIIKNNFSEIGYQIMNPQYINYHLEPIYSLIPNITKSKISRIEIGRPVREFNNNNNSYFSYKNINNYNDNKIPENKSIKCITSTSSNNNTKSKDKYKYRKIYKEKVSPFIHYLIDTNSTKRSIKRRSKIEWLKLFRNFVYIYIFFSSAKKYSNINSKIRNKLINEKMTNIVSDIAILKDWIISMEETFFNEFNHYKKFIGNYLNSQGEQSFIISKNILNCIKIFLDNLKYNLDEIPEKVHSILYNYIKNNSYYPKKYLSKFEIFRLDFNYYGAVNKISLTQSAFILSYFIINGITVQQILLHLKEVFTEYSNCANIEKAAINLSSILHYLVKQIFENKLKIKNDLIALFNYYRNYHLFDERIENMKDKINKKIKIDEKEFEDEYAKNLLPFEDIETLFNKNKKIIEEYMTILYNWAIQLSQNLNSKFFSRSRKNNIKSKLINMK